MPLPENWNGVFYGPGLMDDYLIDWEPPRFVAMLYDHTDGDLSGFIFLIGGAYLDLHLHDLTERADSILKEAEGRYPDVPWNFFRTRTPDLLQFIRSADPKNRSVMDLAIRDRMTTVANTLASAVARLAELAGAERERFAAQLKTLAGEKPHASTF